MIRVNFCLLLLPVLATLSVRAQGDSVMHIGKLEIGKGKTEHITVRNRDSSLVLDIDTLILKKRSTLSFLAAKKVQLRVKHAVIDGKAYITGADNKNNGSHMDIYMHLSKLGALYILTGGRDANNGFRTFPNGNGGSVRFYYALDGIAPQREDDKAAHYLAIDHRAGGYHVIPQRDLYIVYSQIAMGVRSGGGRLGATPQGQIYSGSPGIDGTAEVKGVQGFYDGLFD